MSYPVHICNFRMKLNSCAFGMVSVEIDQPDFRVIFSSYHKPALTFENGKMSQVFACRKISMLPYDTVT